MKTRINKSTRHTAGKKRGGILKRSIAGILAVSMVLAGGSFGEYKIAQAAAGGWNLYSYGGSYSNYSMEDGAISLSWDSSTLFTSGTMLNVYPGSTDGAKLYRELASNSIFSKAGYVCRGGAIASEYSTPYSAEFKFYDSAKSAVDAVPGHGDSYIIQPIMLKTYYYDYNYSGGGTREVNNDISFTNGTSLYFLDTSANQDMFEHSPAREGYTFDGWYTSADGGSRVSAYSTANQAKLYAHWKKNTYHVSVIHGEGISSVSGSGSYSYGDMVTISAATKNGHHFTGWSGDYTNAGSTFSFTMPAGNVSVTANAAPNIHTLNFVLDGETVSSNNSVPYGAEVSDYAPVVAEKNGYTFSGWANMPDTMPDHDLTLMGTYNANPYTMTFISDGTTVKSAIIKYGEPISSVVPSINKPGYAFEGWYTSSEGGNQVSLSGTYQKAGDTTVYAHWIPLYQYDASNSTFYVYSQDAVGQWQSDSTILGAEKLVLGKDIDEIESIPLKKFTNLEEIKVDSSNGSYTSENGMLYSPDKKQLIFCPAKHSDNPVISEECEIIKAGAFADTSTVNKIVLPYSVQTLEDEAFNTSSIKELSMKAFTMDIAKNAVNASTELKVFQGSAGEKYAEEQHINYTLYTVIGDGFFEGTDMESFDVPGNITAIGDEAFRSCVNLEEISIPDSVKSVGSHAFSGDVKLESLDISGVEKIGAEAFSGMSKLREVALSGNIKSLDAGAFRGCLSLDKLLIDNMDCEIAQDYSTIPENVTVQCYAGSTAEQYAAGNNPIILMAGFAKDGLQEYAGSDSGIQVAEFIIGPGLEKIEDSAFEGAGNLKKVTFPENSALKEIGAAAFAGSGLEEIKLPPSVENMGERSFAACENLKRADLSEAQVKTVPEEAFTGCGNLKAADLGMAEEIGVSAFEDCTSLQKLLLQDSVSEVKENALKGCSAIETVTVENQNCIIFDSGETLPAQAGITGYAGSTANVYAEKYHRNFLSKGNAYMVSFDTQGGTGGTEKVYAVIGKEMPEIQVPEKKGWDFGGYYTSTEGGGICYYDEKNGASIKNWDMTSGRTLYAKWLQKSYTVTFHAAGGVSEQSRSLKGGEPYGVLPTAVRDGYIFLGWYTEMEGGDPVSEHDIMAEEDITLYAHWSEKLGENSVPAGFLKGNEDIREITIPRGTVTVCRNAFRDCINLEKVNLPDTVTTIEEGAFAGDMLLSQISLEKVKKLGDNAFEGTALNDLIIEKGCVHLGKEIFKDSALTSVEFKSDVSLIPPGTFSGCSNLESVTIDSPASGIGESAFEGSGLKEIALPKSIETVGRRAFAGCPNLEKITVENKDCILFDSEDTLTGGAVVSGYRASSARVYAERYDYGFEECGVSYEISFDTDGGENRQAGWYAYEGETLQETVAVPEKKGYTFQGYYAGENQMYDKEGNLTDATYEVSSDLQMKAGWEKVEDTENPMLNQTPSPSPSVEPYPIDNVSLPKKGAIRTVGNLKYKVTKSARKNGTVSVVGAKSRKLSKAFIPASVKIDGFTFKATEVSSKAFKGCKKLKYVTLGKNIRKIGSRAFYQDKKLKRVAVKSRKLKAVGKNALKGISKKAVIRMPKSRKKAYGKLLTKRTGFSKSMKTGKLL